MCSTCKDFSFKLHKEVGMISWSLFILLMNVLPIQSYKMKCPVSRQWAYRAASICKYDRSYMCLFNVSSGYYEESCNGPNGIEKGFKLVLQPNVHNRKCESPYYQPFTFSTINNSECVYIRSKCIEEGQTIADMGTNINNTACGCDYTQGYAFVVMPGSTCYCNPSYADCSCYLRKCKTAFPGNHCVESNQIASGHKCPINLKNMTKAKNAIGHIVQEYKNTYYNLNKGENKRIMISTILVVILPVIIIFCVIAYCALKRLAKDTDATEELTKSQFRTINQDAVMAPYTAATNEVRKTESYTTISDTIKTHTDVTAKGTKSQFRTTNEDAVMAQLSKIKIDNWSKRDGIYFETKAFKEVINRLSEERESFVTIIGASGDGKTATAIHVALHLQQMSYKVVVIHNADELFINLNPNEKQCLFIDDPLGKQRLDETALMQWIQSSKRLQDSLLGNNTKIVAIIRKNLFQKYKFQINETIFNKNVIDLSSDENRLTLVEQRSILRNNLQNAGRKLDDEICNLVTSEKYYPGFPLMCHLISQGSDLTPKSKLDPHVVILEQLKELKAASDPFEFCSLIIAVLYGGTFDVNDLICKPVDDVDTRKLSDIINSCGLACNEDCCVKLKNSFEALSGIYFTKSDSVYTILHDSILNGTALVYGADNIVIILKYSSAAFVREYVRTVEASDVDDEKHSTIIVQKKYYTHLVERLIEDLKCGKIVNVFLNPSIYDKNFQKQMQSRFMELKMSDLRTLMSKLPEESTMSLHDMRKFTKCALDVPILSKLPEESKISLDEVRKYTKFALDVAILYSTPIHWLCKLGLLELLKSILSKIDDPLSFLNQLPGLTHPLHFAAGYGHLDIVKYLVNLKIDVNVKSHFELEQGDDDNHFHGFTPLHYAARQNDIKVVEYLLEHEANPNLVGDHGASPMLLAALYGKIEVIRKLLLKKGDPNIFCGHGSTPLIIASQENNSEAVKLLLKHGAKVNHTRTNGTSAIFVASERGYTKCVKILASHGANVNLHNEMSPYSIALKNNHLETAEVLRQWGGDVDRKINTTE